MNLIRMLDWSLIIKMFQFGGKSILLVRDVNQLPEVCAHSLWTLPLEIRDRRLIEKESLFSHLVSINNSRQPDQNERFLFKLAVILLMVSLTILF